MEKKMISSGKRPKDPLRRRVWKDILRDWKRYLMICLMLVATIGFVSGMYVANNSMLNTLSKNTEAMKREDGHFTLSGKADAATIKAIETGELADVPAVYRERAYREAADEVEKAVSEALEDKVSEQVREAVKTQVSAAVDEQITAARAMGAEITDTERESMISSAYDAAIAESYDKAYADALKAARESEDYEKALSDAMDEEK